MASSRALANPYAFDKMLDRLDLAVERRACGVATRALERLDAGVAWAWEHGPEDEHARRRSLASTARRQVNRICE